MNSTELIKEALESYSNYEDGKFEKKSYMNGYYDARLKVSQMQLPVKPEIAEVIKMIDGMTTLAHYGDSDYTESQKEALIDLREKIRKQFSV